MKNLKLFLFIICIAALMSLVMQSVTYVLPTKTVVYVCIEEEGKHNCEKLK